MIRLHRHRDQKIPLSFRGQRRVKRERALLEAKRSGALKSHLKNSLWKPAKPNLIRETHGKCAYCEAPTDTVAHGDVEHFRPKSVWWWLALCYDNYAFSCQVCNQVFKGDAFPLSNSRMSGPSIRSNTSDEKIGSLAGTLAPDPLDAAEGFPRNHFFDACAAEKSLLPDPYAEDPEDLFAYEADEVLHEVRVVPRSPASTDRVVACETHLGLNRQPLRRDRWLRYETLRQVKQAWDVSPAATRVLLSDLFRAEISADKSFAGMSRYFVKTVWQIPGL